jgi:hypothetical protein
MAPTPRPAVHRFAGFIHAARFAGGHLVLAIVVDVIAAAAHLHVMPRLLLAAGTVVGQWLVRERRR